MVAIWRSTIVVGFFALFANAVATSDHASYVPSLSPCQASNAEETINATETHLFCDVDSVVKAFGEKQYSCHPTEDSKKKVEADVIFKKADDGNNTLLHTLVFTNKALVNTVYKVSTTSNDGKRPRTYYWALQGRLSCTVTGYYIEQMGSIDMTAIYAYNIKVNDTMPS